MEDNMKEIKGFAGFGNKEEDVKKEELDKDIQEANVYVVSGQIYKDLETAKKADAINDLGTIVEDMFYLGINIGCMMDEILKHKDVLIEVLQRI